MVPQRIQNLVGETIRFLKRRGVDYADIRWVEQIEEELVVQNRENTSTRKIFFAALARTHFKTAEITPTPELESLFVDACLGVPIETGFQWLAQRKGAPS